MTKLLQSSRRKEGAQHVRRKRKEGLGSSMNRPANGISTAKKPAILARTMSQPRMTSHPQHGPMGHPSLRAPRRGYPCADPASSGLAWHRGHQGCSSSLLPYQEHRRTPACPRPVWRTAPVQEWAAGLAGPLPPRQARPACLWREGQRQSPECPPCAARQALPPPTGASFPAWQVPEWIQTTTDALWASEVGCLQAAMLWALDPGVRPASAHDRALGQTALAAPGTPLPQTPADLRPSGCPPCPRRDRRGS